MDPKRSPSELLALDVPAPLRGRPLWCVWAYEQHDNEPKPRKVPYYSHGGKRFGRQGSPQDRAKLTTFEAARKAAAERGLQGVGLALLPGENIVALDFDKCVEDGAVEPQVLALVQDTYAELSPSGTGIRAVFEGDDRLGNRKSAASSNAFGAEVFSTSGFVTFTGNALDHVDILGLEDRVAPLPERVVEFCRQRFGQSSAPEIADDFTAGYEPVLGLAEAEIANALETIDPDIDRDGWIRCGMALHHETSGSEEGFALWDEWSAQGAKYPGEEALRTQWDSFTRRAEPGRKQVTMASVLALARDAGRVATAESAVAHAELIGTGVLPTSGVETPADFSGRFRVLSAHDVTEQKPLSWFIKNVIPAADVGVIYGASGAGKSFVALDMAACIALGKPWRGHRVTQGKVVIVAAEGGGGYGKRIQAYCRHHGLDPATLPIGVITVAPNILEREEVNELAASILAVGDVAAVIIDTLAQVSPGANENTSEDMGRVLANAMALRRATGAMTIFVHHAGKDLTKGQRGWSGLKGAMDVEIEVSRDEQSGAREIRLTKMKDEEDGLRFGFALETVVLGMDEDGDEYRSCVVIEADLRQKEVSAKDVRLTDTKERTPWQMAVLEVIGSGLAVDGMSVFELVSAAKQFVPAPADGRDRRSENLTRAVRTLAKERDGPIGLAGERVIFYQ